MPDYEKEFEGLKDLLDDHQSGMSDYQDDYLVTVRAGGNLYGQYKQSLRELYKRFRGLRELIYGEHGRKMLDLEIEELEENIRCAEDVPSHDQDIYELRRKKIKLQHKLLLLEESDRAIKDCFREFYRFFQQAREYKTRIGELSPKKRRELEIGMWAWKVREYAVQDEIQSGRLSHRTMELAAVLPPGARRNALQEIGDKTRREKMVERYLDRPEADILDFENMELPQLDVGQIEKQLFLEETFNMEEVE